MSIFISGRKILMKKILIYIFMAASFSLVYGFDEGFIWALKANFNGSATMPSISQSDLDKIGAAYMKGAVGYTMDGEAELGYLFGSKKWFGLDDTSKFSGMSVFASLGVGSGFAGMVSGNTVSGVTAAAQPYALADNVLRKYFQLSVCLDAECNLQLAYNNYILYCQCDKHSPGFRAYISFYKQKNYGQQPHSPSLRFRQGIFRG